MYNTLRDAGVVTNTLPEWSEEMNAQTGSTAYSAGLNDNWIKQTSAGIDDLLEMTGLPDMGANIGRSIGGVFGQEDEAEEIGRSWARMACSPARSWPRLGRRGGYGPYVRDGCVYGHG
jgi:hypothetical protein